MFIIQELPFEITASTFSFSLFSLGESVYLETGAWGRGRHVKSLSSAWARLIQGGMLYVETFFSASQNLMFKVLF